MSIKIHHGPPGSYKTSGAVMDDFIPAAKAGRVVITNVRGLSSRERVAEALDGVPDTFELIYLQTTECQDALENRRKLSTFWHWVPKGAFLLIDECNTIWPTHLREKDLEALDYADSYLNGGADDRPSSILTAFEMHRHFGWDLVLTTPHIDKVHKIIRQCAEAAYKHKNQALIGIKGRYLEAFHLAEDSGRSASDFMNLRQRKISPVTWKLYESTTTGTFADTIAGTPLWKNPKVLLFVGIIAAFGVFLSSRARPSFLGGTPPAIPGAPAKTPGANPGQNRPVGTVPPAAASTSLAGNSRQPGQAGPSPDVAEHPYAKVNLHIVGNVVGMRDGRLQNVYYFQATQDGRALFDLSDADLGRSGYRVEKIAPCAVRLTYKKVYSDFIVCDKPQIKAAPPPRFAASIIPVAGN